MSLCRSRSEVVPASTYQAPALLAPRPRAIAAENCTQASRAAPAASSPQLPVLGTDDIAKQIRAKFENLVRASPLPKVAHSSCASLPSCKLSLRIAGGQNCS